MIIRPEQLPDELDRSYLGALMRFNGKTTEVHITQALVEAFSADLPSMGKSASRLELLSVAAGMPVAAFVQEHSTLPLRRSITPNPTDHAHGSPVNRRIWQLSGMRRCREGAYFCPDCAVADVGFHGRSYWRREHQTPGLYWCAKHRGPLKIVDGDQAFLQAPTLFLDYRRGVDHPAIAVHHDHPVISRYLSICAGLYDRPKPLPVHSVRTAIRRAVEPLGFPRYGAAPSSEHERWLLSDHVRDAYPREWLESILPKFASKRPGQVVEQVDGTLWAGALASAAHVYALVAATLYESSDAALQAFGGQDAKSSGKMASRVDRSSVAASGLC